MSKDPSLPISLTDSLVTDPARTVAADAVYREMPSCEVRAAQPGWLASINWRDPELLSVVATLVFMLLGKWGTAIGLPAALEFWFFLAAYLAETADVIAAAPPWKLGANVKYLGPLFLGWGASMAILVLQRDLGMAALLLATFATMLYVATRRIDIVTFGLAIFAVAAFWAIRHFAYVQARVATWRHPFAAPLGAGYQSSQSYYALAAGGVFGTGFRLGHPGFIPDVATDYVYAALSEELGLIGGIALLAVFLVLVRRILAVAGEQPDLFTKLLAVGMGATLGFQVAIIVGGVVGLFPLTGITLPFVSYGGSSLVANVLLVALVWAMSGRPRRGRDAQAQTRDGA